MSIITLLNADRYLSKTYSADGTSEPYPLVRDFTSTVWGYETIGQLLDILQVTGESGGCMLKGHLSREIINEPRSGLTDATALTDLLIIDYDSDDGFDSIEDLLGEIDPALPQTDYIFQHSASAGIKGAVGLRGHVFIRLSEPTSPVLIKQWLKKVNLTSSRFKARVKLSRNAMALCYALDITVNQNDKLIYVAKPKLKGINDPIQDRFTMHEGTRRFYTYNASVSVELNRTKEHDLINALQLEAGLPKRTPKYKVVGDGEIVVNPAVCAVTGTRVSGKYVQLNLNGGDSWAYWYPVDNLEILYNFKGEPNVYLKDVAPEYYEEQQKVNRNKALRPFVFRDLQTDATYNAEYDETTEQVVMCHQAKRASLIDFMITRGMPAPKVIPDYKVFFDPTSNTSVNFELKEYNEFVPSAYLEAALANKKQKGINSSRFPTIHKIISHICVDEETRNHFYKWLAHIIQFRTKTQTAWVFQGTEGTGKGTLYEHILLPILGIGQAYKELQGIIEGQYNGYLKRNMLLFIDECDMGDAKASERLQAKLRSWITDATVGIREMNTNPCNRSNFTNVIIATNQALPVRINNQDRRYNIAPRQEERLVFERDELALVEAELTLFVTFLSQIKIDKEDVIWLLQNEARSDLQALSKTVADEFFDSLTCGDLDFFAERLQEKFPVPDLGYIAFSRVVQEWLRHAGDKIAVTVDDMVTVYKYIGGNENMNVKKFGHLAKRYNRKARATRIDSIQRKVFDIRFRERDYSSWLNRNDKTLNPTKLQLVSETIQ